MKFGLSLPTKGDFADIHRLVELAVQAEESGWDGFFLWDHIAPGVGPLIDPWIAMAAIASSTRRLRLGLLVTPLSRRRPWKVAREIVALDHLSQGRMVMGVGLGDFQKKEFEAFAEVADRRVRGRMLDEALEIITGLQRGEPFRYAGEHYQIRSQTVFQPRPVQEPRVPVWVAGKWPNKRPFRRAARWDGAVPLARGTSIRGLMPLEVVEQLAAYIAEHRKTEAHFDLCLSGVLPGKDPAEQHGVMAPYQRAGVTWWIEFVYSGRGSLRKNQDRLRRGPPRA